MSKVFTSASPRPWRVVFHEIPHELGNFFVLLYAGFTKRRALIFNFLSALFAVLGNDCFPFTGFRGGGILTGHVAIGGGRVHLYRGF